MLHKLDRNTRFMEAGVLVRVCKFIEISIKAFIKKCKGLVPV